MNLKKYIFANITSVLGYLPIIFKIFYQYNSHLPVGKDDMVSDAYFIGAIIGICGEIIIISFALTILEILIRKLLTDRVILNFKFNIKLPKIIYVFYTILFSIGLLSALILALICFILCIESYFM